MVLSTLVKIDLSFLVVCIIALCIFLAVKRKNIERQGILYLYKTKLGIKYIDNFAKKYSKILKPLQYVIVTIGYALMLLAIWSLFYIVYIYAKIPKTSIIAKVPPIFPVIPYFNDILGIKDIFPITFSFTYFLIAIVIVAVFHEFSHGIFMRLNKIKIKSTGFAILNIFRIPLPIVGAFVEQDDKQMTKAKIFPQLSILSAGTFANSLLTILFAVIMIVFFSLAFVPSGVLFGLASSPVVATDIQSYSNVTFGNITYGEIIVNNQTYFTSLDAIHLLQNGTAQGVYAIDNSPAFNSQLKGMAIYEIDGQKIKSYSDLNNSLSSHSPGDVVNIKTISDDGVRDFNIKLGEKNGRAYLGIGIPGGQTTGLLGLINLIVSRVKSPQVYYQSRVGVFGTFINDLLWWLILINFAVAVTNMIPAGIFDGGRFFMLTVLGITKKQKIADRAFKIATAFVILVFLFIMFKWALNRFF